MKLVLLRHGESQWNKENRFPGWTDIDLTDEEILKINIPTGIPLVYDLDEKLQVKSKGYLGDEETINRAISLVKNQGKSN